MRISTKSILTVLALLILIPLVYINIKTENRLRDLEQELLDTFEAGQIDEAKRMIAELDELTETYDGQFKFSYNDDLMSRVKHKMYTVKGRIEVFQGNIEQAKTYLILSAKVKGSPTLNNFGPNMSLAQDLLMYKETETVLTYFDLCSKFWKDSSNKLDTWRTDIAQGEMPVFKANLVY